MATRPTGASFKVSDLLRIDEAFPIDHRPAALLALLSFLAEREYRFITPTPLTHRRVVQRRGRDLGRGDRDVFGWNLPFAASGVDDRCLSLMREAGVLIDEAGGYRSRIRVATVGTLPFLHSGFPTVDADAVFFGPDTYRFIRFVTDAVARLGAPAARCVEIGCGSGAAALVQATQMTGSAWTLSDINPRALEFAAINARHAGIAAQCVASDILASLEGSFDLVICNPPYLDDPLQRAYRHGGGDFGRALSVRIAREAIGRLNPGGTLLLYTGVAVLDGRDPLRSELAALLDDEDCQWRYSEIDPDVFGEELETLAYAAADRIAAVGLIATRAPA